MRTIILASIVFALCACAPVSPGSLRPTQNVTATETPVILATATKTPTLAPVSPQVTTLCVMTDTLTLRSDTGKDAPAVRWLQMGEPVTILASGQAADGGAWSFVRVGADTGWVNSDYLGECK